MFCMLEKLWHKSADTQAHMNCHCSPMCIGLDKQIFSAYNIVNIFLLIILKYVLVEK